MEAAREEFPVAMNGLYDVMSPVSDNTTKAMDWSPLSSISQKSTSKGKELKTQMKTLSLVVFAIAATVSFATLTSLVILNFELLKEKTGYDQISDLNFQLKVLNQSINQGQDDLRKQISELVFQVCYVKTKHDYKNIVIVLYLSKHIILNCNCHNTFK